MTADKTPSTDAPAREDGDAAETEAQPDTDDIKAKFRAALRHKEHHDGPDVGSEHDKSKGPEAKGAKVTKREFRRKTG